MASAVEDIEFLARSGHRLGVLEALGEGPCDRDDLCGATGASSPTIGRILADFEDRRWVERDGPTYELTPLGAFVADRFDTLREGMETERKLRDVWEYLPREMEGFSVDLLADAVVSYPGPDYPYEPVERVSHLLERTTSMHGFGTTVFKSVNNELVCQRIIDGMEYEFVFPPDILKATVDWNPERVAEAAAQDNCTVLIHEDLPDVARCGLCVFDDRVGICCHNSETGMLEATIDTGAPEAQKWARSVYDHQRAEARPLTDQDKAELFPDGLVV